MGRKLLVAESHSIMRRGNIIVCDIVILRTVEHLVGADVSQRIPHDNVVIVL